MKRKGSIATWHHDRGYGFIDPSDGRGRVFVHIKAFRHSGRRPVVGDRVTFTMGHDGRGRPCAEGVNFTDHSRRRKARSRIGFAPLLVTGFILLLCGAAFADAIPSGVVLLYLAASAITFAAYALDKRAARRGSWRTSESTLHAMALIGGWPGAWFAQMGLRHKTRKQPFRTLFWITVALNLAALLWLSTPEGGDTWQAIIMALRSTIA